MRWWWLIALVACAEKSPPKPRNEITHVVTYDAAIDALAMTPQNGEVAITGAQPFYLDKTEVTIADYRACIAANACSKTTRGAETHGKDPSVAMNGVTFHQARAYCTWKGKRLPTPDEWNRAAYGGGTRKYPWGDEAPTCERANFRACNTGEGPAAPGRPAGASPFGVLDMIGNVSEFTDPPAPAPKDCFDTPRDEVPVLGGDYGGTIDSPRFERDSTIANQAKWFDDAGIRCARSLVPAPAQDWKLPPMTWVLTVFARGKDAVLEMERRCKTGDGATLVAGELVGQTGWAVISGVQPAPAGTIKVTPSPELVRVVGAMSCDFAETMTLVVKTGNKTSKLEFPTRIRAYELWLPRGTWVTFDLECKPPPDRGACAFGVMKSSPATYLVPNGPPSGVEGPTLAATGGVTCD